MNTRTALTLVVDLENAVVVWLRFEAFSSFVIHFKCCGTLIVGFVGFGIACLLVCQPALS